MLMQFIEQKKVKTPKRIHYEKILTSLAVIMVTAALWAQAPRGMTYQALVRDADEQLITNIQVGIRISILKYIFRMPPSFEDVYVETNSIYSTNENGLLTVRIGMLL